MVDNSEGPSGEPEPSLRNPVQRKEVLDMSSVAGRENGVKWNLASRGFSIVPESPCEAFSQIEDYADAYLKGHASMPTIEAIRVIAESHHLKLTRDIARSSDNPIRQRLAWLCLGLANVCLCGRWL